MGVTQARRHLSGERPHETKAGMEDERERRWWARLLLHALDHLARDADLKNAEVPDMTPAEAGKALKLIDIVEGHLERLRARITKKTNSGLPIKVPKGPLIHR
jgi:hypothetical protein